MQEPIFPARLTVIGSLVDNPYIKAGYAASLTRWNEARCDAGHADEQLVTDVRPPPSIVLHGPPGCERSRKLDEPKEEEVEKLVAAHVAHVDVEAIVGTAVGHPVTWRRRHKKIAKRHIRHDLKTPAWGKLCRH